MRYALLLLSFLMLLGSIWAADENSKKPYVLYAQFLQDTRVELSDGAVWMMDKGDCFPVYMFKEHQTKVVLKLASATFQVDAVALKVLPDSQSEPALDSYRKNLEVYLKSRPEAWKRDSLKKKKKDAEKPAAVPEPASMPE